MAEKTTKKAAPKKPYTVEAIEVVVEEPLADPQAGVRELEYHLIGLRSRVKQAAYDEDSDIRRTHMNNIASAIVGLAEGMKQEHLWDRTWEREVV